MGIGLGYASSAMYSKTGLWLDAVLLVLAFFLAVPAIAVAIGYAAWKGKPQNFSRGMYWTAFVAAIAVSLFLMVYAQRMHADVRTWQYLVQIACFGLGVLVFGVAGGCMVGIFTYRRRPGTRDPDK
jgi:multisubunit Na+/H+ antiporter MnhG subunit